MKILPFLYITISTMFQMKNFDNQDLVFDGVVIFEYYKMINLDSITNENNKEHNEKWPYIPDSSHRILIIGGSGSWKTNACLNFKNEQDDID